MRIARVMELLVGVTFLVAAAGKTYDMYGFSVQVRGYGIFPANADTEMALAWAMTGIEALIGAALIAGLHLRGMMLAGTAALLVAFTGLIVYGWAFHDLADCGCFGTTIQMSPGASIAKNVILLLMTGYAWYELHNASPEVDRKLRSPALAVAGAGLAAVFAVGLIGGEPTTLDDENRVVVEIDETDLKERPFAQFVFKKDDGSQLDMGTGKYLAAILNADCPHCQESVKALNQVAVIPEFPQVVGLVMARDEDEKSMFQAITSPQFETYNIDLPTLMQFVHGTPPAFYKVVDGADEGYLEIEDLTAGDLLKLVEDGSNPDV